MQARELVRELGPRPERLEHEHEEQAQGPGVLGEEAPVRAQGAPDRLHPACVAHVRHQRVGLPAREGALHDGPQQSLLGAEVPEDRAAAYARRLADRLDRRVAVASLGEQARRGVDQALARLLRLLTLAGRRGLGHSGTVASVYADRPT